MVAYGGGMINAEAAYLHKMLWEHMHAKPPEELNSTHTYRLVLCPKEKPEYYKLRQQISEHQFGTLKRQWGFTYTLMKGKEHVLSEVKLMMMVYNLRRLMSILGVNDLKTKLKQLVLFFFAQLKLHRVDLRIFVFSISN
jgi:hypothetical protein